jgi:OmpA-OmpF porin, OOP family
MRESVVKARPGGSRQLRCAVCFAALVAALIALRGEASAQAAVAGFAVDRFEPAAPGSRFLSLESLDFEGHLRPAAGLVSAWAWKPLVVYDGQANQVSALVAQQLVEHLQGAIVLWDRARVDLDLPVPLVHSGTTTVVGMMTYAAPEGSGVGDLRLGADVRLIGRVGSPFIGAVGAQLFLPTGDPKAFSSDGGVRFWPQLKAAGLWRDRLSWAGRLGVHIRPQHGCNCDLSPGSELTAGAGARWRFLPRLAAGPELYFASAIAGGPFASRAGTSLELLLAGHFAVAPRWNVSLGVAPGLSDGAGTPAARAVLAVQYVVEPARVRPPEAPPPWTPASADGAVP